MPLKVTGHMIRLEKFCHPTFMASSLNTFSVMMPMKKKKKKPALIGCRQTWIIPKGWCQNSYLCTLVQTRVLWEENPIYRVNFGKWKIQKCFPNYMKHTLIVLNQNTFSLPKIKIWRKLWLTTLLCLLLAFTQLIHYGLVETLWFCSDHCGYKIVWSLTSISKL